MKTKINILQKPSGMVKYLIVCRKINAQWTWSPKSSAANSNKDYKSCQCCFSPAV